MHYNPFEIGFGIMLLYALIGFLLKWPWEVGTTYIPCFLWNGFILQYNTYYVNLVVFIWKWMLWLCVFFQKSWGNSCLLSTELFLKNKINERTGASWYSAFLFNLYLNNHIFHWNKSKWVSFLGFFSYFSLLLASFAPSNCQDLSYRNQYNVFRDLKLEFLSASFDLINLLTLS